MFGMAKSPIAGNKEENLNINHPWRPNTGIEPSAWRSNSCARLFCSIFDWRSEGDA